MRNFTTTQITLNVLKKTYTVCLYKDHIDDNYSDKTCQTKQGVQDLCTPRNCMRLQSEKLQKMPVEITGHLGQRSTQVAGHRGRYSV
jgi:hypothetical protein